MTRFSPRLFVSMLSCAMLLALGTQPAQAEDTKYRVQLIWGTNEDNATKRDPSLEEVDPKLVERLAKIFKWKHYYRVKIKSQDVPDPVVVQAGKAKRLVLSPKCEVEIKSLEHPMLEVKLFGEGKLVKKVTQAVPPKECLVMAGDAKDDTAWFVVISRR